MNVLHVVSNFRWTERAELAADLAVAQGRLGLEVTFACGRNTAGEAEEDTVSFQAARKGLAPVELELEKHLRLASAMRDIAPLRRLILERRADVVHCHMPNANLLVALAVRGMERPPVVVRSVYEPGGPEWPVRWRLLCATRTDGVILLNEEGRAALGRQFRREPWRAEVMVPGIDVDRFAGRADIGPLEGVAIPPDSFVVGMIARFGFKRRPDLLLAATARLAPRYPRLRLLLVGRGGIRQAVLQPAASLGVSDRLLLAGYCRGDRLVAAYRSMHALVYPWPGTDQSCRAVREAMAAGLPVIASRVGFLPHLIEDGISGRLVAPDGAELAGALAELMDQPAVLRRMAAAAADTARRRFSREAQARAVTAFYERLLAARGRP
jgi:glycosyltransferase involved in cell wall biosynthesis